MQTDPIPELVLTLGDNLFDGLPGMPGNAPVWMMEDRVLCTRVRHHQQKLTLFLSAMRHFAAALTGNGRSVFFHRLEQQTHADLIQALTAFVRNRSVQVVHAYWCHDAFIRAELAAALADSGASLQWVESPMFLTPRSEWDRYRRDHRRLRMGDFYQFQRQRLHLLLDDNGGPQGGQWSFDEENRKSLPKSVVPPAIWTPAPDPVTQEVMALVKREFPVHPGDANQFAYPVTHAEAAEWLDQFLAERLAQFGPYEDALSVHHRTVFHGVLTPMLNCGLLTPGQVVEAAMARENVPLASREGFIRQVIGWREFVYHVSDDYDPANLPNFFDHHRRLRPDAWWNGSTGLPPLDWAIHRARDYGYAHHIERLMVLGSAMLMAEVHPAESYQWFMEMFVDSADWVMLPNVIGMSQFADGGKFATKPYLSGSSYLRKMGDYPAGPWTEVWDGLYWRFIHRHREFFAGNHRMSMMAKSVDRLDPIRRDRIFAAAENWIESVTEID